MPIGFITISFYATCRVITPDLFAAADDDAAFSMLILRLRRRRRYFSLSANATRHAAPPIRHATSARAAMALPICRQRMPHARPTPPPTPHPRPPPSTSPTPPPSTSHLLPSSPAFHRPSPHLLLPMPCHLPALDFRHAAVTMPSPPRHFSHCRCMFTSLLLRCLVICFIMPIRVYIFKTRHTPLPLRATYARCHLRDDHYNTWDIECCPTPLLRATGCHGYATYIAL